MPTALPYRKSVDVRALAYPIAAIRTHVKDAYRLHDNLPGLLRIGAGESASTTNADTNDAPSQWQNQPLVMDDIVDVVRFLSTGEVIGGTTASQGQEIAAALVLKPRRLWQNATMLPLTGSEPRGSGSFPALTFRSVQKSGAAGWQTVQGDAPPLHTGIQHVGALPYKPVIAETVQPFAAMQQWEAYVHWLGLTAGQNDKGNYRLWWGGVWSVAFRQNGKPTIDRLQPDNSWAVRQCLDTAPDCTYEGDWKVTVRSEYGRLMLGINEQFWHLLDVTPAVGAGDLQTTALQWPAARFRVSSYGVEAKLDLALLTKKEADGSPRTGFYSRLGIPHSVRRGSTTVTTVGTTAGYQTARMDTTVLARMDESTVQYAGKLVADPDGNDGPAVSHIHASFPGQTQQSTPTPLDLRPAITTARGVGANPALSQTSGWQWTMELNRRILDRKVAGWRDVLDDRSPLELSIRWRLSDNTYEPWVNVFKGYAWKLRPALNAYGERMLSCIFRDDMIRLSKPAALVNRKFGPLDALALPGQDLYFGDMLQELLRIQLGDEVAALINGTGNPREFETTGYPLLAQTLNGTGYYPTVQPRMTYPLFPAPFKSYVEEWAKELAAKAREIFFIGNNPAAPQDWPVFMCGRYPEIVRSRTPKVIPDRDYDGIPLDRLLFSGSSEGVPEKQINTVEVWGTAGGQLVPNGGAEFYLPAYIMESARVDPNDPNAPEKSWESFHLITSDAIYDAQEAQGTAQAVLNEIAGRKPRHPSLTLQGDATMDWGDLLTPHLTGTNSDTQLDLSGVNFRVIGPGHSLDLTSDAERPFTTDCTVYPTTASGY